MNINKALQNSIIGLLFVIPFIPLVVMSSMYFPYITGKGFLFRTLIEIAFILYAMLAIRDRSFLPKKSPLGIAMGVFVLILGLATLFSENPLRSFWSNYERMEGYITILHLLAYVTMVATVFNKKIWYWFAHTTLAASIIIGLRGFADTENRISGTLGNSTYLGVYALLHMFIAGYFLLQTLHKRAFNEAVPFLSGYLVLIVFNAFVLFKTGTRGSFIGLVLGAIVTAILLAIFERRNKIIRFAGISTLAVVVLLVGTLGLAKNTSFVQGSSLLTRFSSLITTDIGSVFKTQGYARSVVWSMAYEGYKDRPVLGWGQDNFNYVFAKHFDPRMYAQEQWFDRSHNVFFDWLIAGGLLGLLGYLSLFVTALYLIWKKYSQELQEPWTFSEKAALTGLFVAYFIHNLFVFDHLVSYLIFFALLGYIHHRSTSYVHHHSVVHKNLPLIKDEGTQYLVGGLVAIAVVLVMYSAVIKPYMASYYLIKAMQSQMDKTTTSGQKIAGDYATALVYFKKVFALDSFGSGEARERFAEVAGPIVTSSTTDIAVRKGYAELMQATFTPQVDGSDKDPRPVLFYALYLQKIGQTDAAIHYMEKVLQLSPNKQVALFQMVMLYFEKQEYAKAAEYAKQAYELDKSYNEALSIYVAVLIYNKQADIAEQEIAAAKERGLDISSDVRIIEAYTDTKQYGRVVELLKLQVANNPQNAQAHVSLAAAYMKINDRQHAISELEAAIEIEPSFKAQGELYIQQIRAGKDPSQTAQ